MTAPEQRKTRRHYSYGFKYKVLGSQAKWQARVNDGSMERTLEGAFNVSTMVSGETFENRVVTEIHRAIDALESAPR
jgi:hypothetical protein